MDHLTFNFRTRQFEQAELAIRPLRELLSSIAATAIDFHRLTLNISHASAEGVSVRR